jgi:hypothetical protein
MRARQGARSHCRGQNKVSARAGTRRRPKTSPYRCFLSDLTGFGELRRAGPTRTLAVSITPPRGGCQPEPAHDHWLRIALGVRKRNRTTPLSRCRVAERAGFEPAEPFGSRALQARALDQTTLPLHVSPALERAGIGIIARGSSPLPVWPAHCLYVRSLEVSALGGCDKSLAVSPGGKAPTRLGLPTK